MFRFLQIAVILLVALDVAGQCPTGTITTSFTVTTSCTVAGNLTIDEGTLTVNPGVILAITGKLINDENSNVSALINGGGNINIGDKFENLKGGHIVIDNVTMTITGEFDSDKDNTDVTLQGGTSVTASKFKGGKNSEIILNNASVSVTGDFENNKDNADLTMTNGSSISAVDYKVAKNSITSIDNSTVTLSGKWEGAKDNADLTVTNGSDITTGDEFKIGKGAEITITDSELDVTGQFKGDKDNVDITITGSDVSVSGDFKGGKNGEIIVDGSDLAVGGDLKIDKDGSDLTISNGGDLDVTGDLKTGKNSDVNVGTTGGGSLSVGGDFDNSKDNADINIGDGGLIDVDGSFSNGKNSDVVVGDGGGLIIDTDLDNSKNNSNITIESGGAASVGGTVTDPDAGFVSLAGDDCSDGCCGTDCTILPVELVSFGATDGDNGLLSLHWHTATELNNEGFEVQESSDGENYQTIGFIEGHGTTSNPNTYYFDCYPNYETSFYRLKQIDYDGAYEYSPVIVSTKGTLIDQQPIVGPNPFPRGSQLLIQHIDPVVTQYYLYSLNGNLIYQSGEDSTASKMEALNSLLNQVNPGTYILVMVNGDQHFTEKLIVKD